jgi:hypothetical protein
MELISISTVPGFAPSIMPPSPSATSFTCGEFGSMVMITSLLGNRFRRRGGFCACGNHFGNRFRITVGNHQRVTCFERFLLIGLPMMPRPIKPTFIVMSLSLLFRWWLFLKGISQFLRGGAEYAQIAADGDKVAPHSR